MKIIQHLDKDNLHHAYLIEGARDEVVPAIFDFFKDLGIKTVGNSDFIHINLDSFKIEDARNLKSYGMQKGLSSAKKIFIISANNFLLEAQNTLLKMFEEPIENTHFFLIVPDVNTLLKTLVSRFYLISAGQELAEETEEAKKFIILPLKNRIDFIKELLTEPEGENEEGNEITVLDSTRSKAIKFLNALEFTLHKNKISRATLDIFEHIFKVREFLRMPGSSTKSLMESVALIIPEKVF
jgi:DNA polymerase III delta prime subunit